MKLFVISVAALASLTLARGATGAGAPQHIDISGRGESLADRVGTDDGAAFIVQFTGDIHGSIDSCG